MFSTVLQFYSSTVLLNEVLSNANETGKFVNLFLGTYSFYDRIFTELTFNIQRVTFNTSDWIFSSAPDLKSAHASATE